MNLLAKLTHRCLFLLLVIGLGACQRTTYSFQARKAFNEMPVPQPTDPPAATLVASRVGKLPTAEDLGLYTLPRHRTHKPRNKWRPQSATNHQESVKAVSTPQVERRAAQALAAYSHPRQSPLPGEPTHFRSRGIALLLAIFLGGLGAHLFYLNYHGRGVAYLVGSLAGTFLITIGFIAAIGAILGGGSSGIGFFTVGVVLLSAVSVLNLVDTVLILTNGLKPKNGEYYPQFFQTRSNAGEPKR